MNPDTPLANAASCKWTREYFTEYYDNGEEEERFEFATECGDYAAFNGCFLPESVTKCKFCQKPIQEIDPESPTNK
jgi:hypothetical protein